MIVIPRRVKGAPLDELGYAVVGAHAGPHRSHLISHVGEVFGLDAGDGLHLGRRLHLEDADGVGLVHHLVHRLVLKVDAAEVDVVALPFFDEQQGFLHLG